LRGKGFVRVRVKSAGADIPLNGGVELLRVERFEPRAKPRKLARGKLFDGFFDVFGGCHFGNITPEEHGGKALGLRLGLA
jgi:hypothetical protein